MFKCSSSGISHLRSVFRRQIDTRGYTRGVCARKYMYVKWNDGHALGCIGNGNANGISVSYTISGVGKGASTVNGVVMCARLLEYALRRRISLLDHDQKRRHWFPFKCSVAFVPERVVYGSNGESYLSFDVWARDWLSWPLVRSDSSGRGKITEPVKKN